MGRHEATIVTTTLLLFLLLRLAAAPATATAPPAAPAAPAAVLLVLLPPPLLPPCDRYDSLIVRSAEAEGSLPCAGLRLPGLRGFGLRSGLPCNRMMHVRA